MNFVQKRKKNSNLEDRCWLELRPRTGEGIKLDICIRDLEPSFFEVDESLSRKAGSICFECSVRNIKAQGCGTSFEAGDIDPGSFKVDESRPEKLGASVLNVLFGISKLKDVALAFKLGVSILDPLWLKTNGTSIFIPDASRVFPAKELVAILIRPEMFLFSGNLSILKLPEK